MVTFALDATTHVPAAQGPYNLIALSALLQISKSLVRPTVQPHAWLESMGTQLQESAQLAIQIVRLVQGLQIQNALLVRLQHSCIRALNA